MSNDNYKNRKLEKSFVSSSGYATNNNETVPETFEVVSKFDNGFVQRPIPRSDFQYSWVTASVMGEHRSEYPFDYASDRNWLDGKITSSVKLDFSYGTIYGTRGLATFIDPDENILRIDGNEIQYRLDLVDFSVNAPTHHAGYYYYLNGPFANPVFSQIRTGEHSVVKSHRRTGRIDTSEAPRSIVTSDGMSVTEKHNQATRVWLEPLVDVNSMPMIHSVMIAKARGISRDIVEAVREYKYDFSSERTYFAHENLNKFIGTEKKDVKDYNLLKDGYTSTGTPVKDFLSLQYSQVIWPRSRNTFLSKVRNRPHFDFKWRSRRLDRNKTDRSTSQGGVFATSSIWHLDSRPAFAVSTEFSETYQYDTASLFTTSSLSHHINTGELQNPSMWWHNGNLDNISMSVSYDWQGITDPTTDGVFMSNDTEFRAAIQAGVEPFEDTHARWTQFARVKGKDMSSLPEFRISEHMEKYIIDNGANFLADIPELWTVTGSVISNSADELFFEVYNSSDILRDFDKLRKDHDGLGEPTRLELTTKVLMKFTPYEGFYPVERTVQMATLLSQSLADNIAVEGNSDHVDRGFGWRPILHATFAPGITYNSIKSGVGVSFPMITSSVALTQLSDEFRDWNRIYSIANNGTIKGDSINSPVETISFESILEPSSIKNTFIDMHQHPSGSINVTSSINPGISLYSLAANNFYAESTNFFLKTRGMSLLTSEPDSSPSHYMMNLQKEYKMRVYFNSAEILDEYDIFDKAAADTVAQAVATDFGVTGEYLINASSGLLVSGSDRFYKSKKYNYYRPYYDNNDILADTTASLEPSPDYGISKVWFFKNGRKFGHYGSGFGAPVNVGSSVGLFKTQTEALITNIHGSFSYSTYTPSCFNGFSFCEVTFKPFDEAGDIVDQDRFRKFTLEEILTNLTYKNYRITDSESIRDYYKFLRSEMLPSVVTDLPAIKGFQVGDISILYDAKSQQITDSINVFDSVKNKDLEYDVNGNPVFVKDNVNQGDRWTIYPKWECPSFDYTNVSKPLPVSGSSNISKGIWYDYSEDNQYSYMQILDIPNRRMKFGLETVGEEEVVVGRIVPVDRDMTGSLADVVGFPKEPIKLGQVADKTKIREAIVAIPFIENNGIRTFIKINPEITTRIAEGHTTLANGERIGNSIIDCVKKMKKYVIPPQFDFVTYDGRNGKESVDPIVMYLMEFEYELDKQDLTRVWHNLAPKSIMKEAQAKIGHELMSNELMETIIDDKMKWMVFKVKQKAEWNYYRKTFSSKDDDRFQFDFKGNDILKRPDYSYNWPYDYCSVVELAKVEATIKIESPAARDIRRQKKSIKELGNKPVPEQSDNKLKNRIPGPSRADAFTTLEAFPITEFVPALVDPNIFSGQFLTDESGAMPTVMLNDFIVMDSLVIQEVGQIIEPTPIATRAPAPEPVDPADLLVSPPRSVFSIPTTTTTTKTTKK